MDYAAFIIFIIAIIILFVDGGWAMPALLAFIATVIYLYNRSVRDLHQEKPLVEQFAALPDEVDTSDTVAAYTSGGPYQLPRVDDLATPIIPVGPTDAQTGSPNIDALSMRMQQHRSAAAKRATDGAVRSTRAIFDKYFADEFAENDTREWWGDNEGVDADWRPL